jgi:hypothetical protein
MLFGPIPLLFEGEISVTSREMAKRMTEMDADLGEQESKRLIREDRPILRVIEGDISLVTAWRVSGSPPKPGCIYVLHRRSGVLVPIPLLLSGRWNKNHLVLPRYLL